MKDPCLPNWEVVIWIVRYLRAHSGHGFLYKANGYLLAKAFVDANWTGYRKSTNGYCTFLGGNLITWKSKKQIVLVRSNVEAKYRAMTHIMRAYVD